MLKLEGYKPTERIETKDFTICSIEANRFEADYQTFIANKEAIKKQRGGTWPDGTETLEENKIDLSWHQREFELGTSFAYHVMSPDESQILGCVYFYPPKHPNNAAAQYEPEGIDVSVNFWVTEAAFEGGLYDQLYHFVQQWVKDWPFKNPSITNLIKPDYQ